MQISLAPLQGYTDFIFRNAINKHIGGIDKFYTPYLRLQNDGTLKNKDIRDVLPQNNTVLNLIPQILVNNSRDFIWCCNYLNNLGYSEVNWNLGCPYPMVAKRMLGSGLLSYPELIRNILKESIAEINMDLSVKLRLGYSSSDEINEILPIFNEFSIKEIILHPRIGKELYKNEANIELFSQVNSNCKSKLVYNGDVENYSRFEYLSNKFPEISHFMIGRGILKNLFLALEIKGTVVSEQDKRNKLLLFHADILDNYSKMLSGDTHILNKMSHVWEYLSFMFDENRKIHKKIKKINKIGEFEVFCNQVIENARFCS